MKIGVWLSAIIALICLACVGCAEKKEAVQTASPPPGGVQHGNKTVPQGAMPPPGYKFDGQKQ